MTDPPTSTRGRWLGALGTAAILVGVLLLAWYAWDAAATRRAQREALRTLETPSDTPPAKAPERPKPGALVARIQVPEVGLDAVAFEGIDADTLKRGAGHFPGTALPGGRGNAAFAAHRDSFFRGLRRIELGDEILVATSRGEFRYRVSEMRVVEPTRVEVVESRGRDELTLITCHPFDHIGPAPRRFVVHAIHEKRISE